MTHFTISSGGAMLARRQFLNVGGLSAMPGLLSYAGAIDHASNNSLGSASQATFGRAKRCVLLFLTGGPSPHETWDPKPNAPSSIRGEFSPIETSAQGITISEMFPKLAAMAHQFRIVRSLTHSDTVHVSAGYSMLTGGVHPQANNVADVTIVKPSPFDRPHLGCVVHKCQSEQEARLPPFALPEIIKEVDNAYPGQNSGFLGKRYEPVLVDANNERSELLPSPISLPLEVPVDRLQARVTLRANLDQQLFSQYAPEQAELLYRNALELVKSPSLQDAFRLNEESAAVRDAYGPHLFGQGAILARRLLEADVRFVTVYWHYEGSFDSPMWDTHENNFRHMRERLAPPADRAISQFLMELSQRGLLDETLVLCLGEFGRTPKVNSFAGRDHWPFVSSALVAGAGIPGGTVAGASDRDGAYPLHTPISPEDWGSTLLHWLGVAPDQHLHDQLGRPHRAGLGEVRPELFG